MPLLLLFSVVKIFMILLLFVLPSCSSSSSVPSSSSSSHFLHLIPPPSTSSVAPPPVSFSFSSYLPHITSAVPLPQPRTHSSSSHSHSPTPCCLKEEKGGEGLGGVGRIGRHSWGWGVLDDGGEVVLGSRKDKGALWTD